MSGPLDIGNGCHEEPRRRAACPGWIALNLKYVLRNYLAQVSHREGSAEPIIRRSIGC